MSYDRAQIRFCVEEALDYAERVWNRVGDELVEHEVSRVAKAFVADSMATDFPGRLTIEPESPEVDYFIAFVADMRDSTRHLLCAI